MAAFNDKTKELAIRASSGLILASIILASIFLGGNEWLLCVTDRSSFGPINSIKKISLFQRWTLAGALYYLPARHFVLFLF